MWDKIQLVFFNRLGCAIDPKTEKALVPREVWEKEIYTGKSIDNPDVRTWMINSAKGCCLIFEHKHFEII